MKATKKFGLELEVEFSLNCITISAMIGKKRETRVYHGFTEYEARGLFLIQTKKQVRNLN